jgi:hypothetical protein
MVWGEAFVGVYWTPHVSETRVHVVALKVPAPGGVAVKDTVSPLVDPYAPETVAVHVEVSPTMVMLVHVNDVEVMALATASSVVPQLAALSVSPG